MTLMQCHLIGPPTFHNVEQEWNRPFTRPYSPVRQKWSGNKSSLPLATNLKILALGFSASGHQQRHKRNPTLRFLSPPSSKCLHLLSVICFLFLHVVHSILNTIFLVVLAYREWKTTKVIRLVIPHWSRCSSARFHNSYMHYLIRDQLCIIVSFGGVQRFTIHIILTSCQSWQTIISLDRLFW